MRYKDDLKVTIPISVTFGDNSARVLRTSPDVNSRVKKEKHHTENLKHKSIIGLDLVVTATLTSI